MPLKVSGVTITTFKQLREACEGCQLGRISSFRPNSFKHENYTRANSFNLWITNMEARPTYFYFLNFFQ